MSTWLPPLDDTPLDEAGELLLDPELQQLADALRGEAARLAEQIVPQQAASELIRRLGEQARMEHTFAEEESDPVEDDRQSGVEPSWRDAAMLSRRSHAQVEFSGDPGVARKRNSWNAVLVGSLATLCILSGVTAAWLLMDIGRPNVPSDSAAIRSATPERPATPIAPNTVTRPDTKQLAGTRRTDGRVGAAPRFPGPAVSSQLFLSLDPAGSASWGGVGEPAVYREPGESGDVWVADPKRLESELLMTTAGKMQVLEQALERYRSVIEFQQDRILQDRVELRAAQAEIDRLREELEAIRPEPKRTVLPRNDSIGGP